MGYTAVNPSEVDNLTSSPCMHQPSHLIAEVFWVHTGNSHSPSFPSYVWKWFPGLFTPLILQGSR